jgi:hypothetical protein
MPDFWSSDGEEDEEEDYTDDQWDVFMDEDMASLAGNDGGLWGNEPDPYSTSNETGIQMGNQIYNVPTSIIDWSAQLGNKNDDDSFYYEPGYPTIGGTSTTSGPMHLPTAMTNPVEPMVTGGGTPEELNPDGTPVTETNEVTGSNNSGSGGGMREIRPGVWVPEGLSLTELLRAGHITKEIYDSVSSELRDKTPDELDNTIVPDPDTVVTPVDNTIVTPVDNTTLTNTDMTLEQEEELAELKAKNAELQSQVDNFGNLQGQGDLTTGETNVTGGETNVTGGETNVTGGETNVTGGAVSTDVSSTGGTGGNVTFNIGDGTGGSNAGYENFFNMINSYIASGKPIEEGDVKGIYEQFIETSPQSADAIRSFLALDRPVSEEQAQLKTDIYGNIIGDVREDQSPLMQSLARRSDQLGAQAEGLMGPLSFLENRDATQAGYGQAVAGGRGLGNISEMLAGRQRAEQKNVNLNLAGNLLGQQRATAGLMADIESGIYGQMAPDIGMDFGSLLGISGVDVQNTLGERQSTRAANAYERGANIKLGIEAAPLLGNFAKEGYDWIKRLGKKDSTN